MANDTFDQTKDQPSAAFGASVYPEGESAPAPEPATPLQVLQHAADTLKKTKAWALVKADTVEQRIKDTGGEPNGEVKAALAEVRDLAED